MKVFLIGIFTIFAICLVVTTHAGSLRPHGKYHERLIQEEKEQLKASGIEGEDANHLLEWASSNVMLPNMHGNEKEEELTKEEPKIEKKNEETYVMKAPTYESKIEKKKQIQQKNMNNEAEDEKMKQNSMEHLEPKIEEKKEKGDITKVPNTEPKIEEKKEKVHATKAPTSEPKHEEKKEEVSVVTKAPKDEEEEKSNVVYKLTEEDR